MGEWRAKGRREGRGGAFWVEGAAKPGRDECGLGWPGVGDTGFDGERTGEARDLSLEPHPQPRR